MRNRRRNKPSIKDFSFDFEDTIKGVSLVLKLLITIFLIIFIASCVRFKLNVSSNTKIGNISNETEATEDDDSDSENGISSEYENVTDSKEEEKNEKQPSATVNMAFTGDIMCHNTIFNDAYNASTETYDFSYIFENIKYYLQTPDITIGNLETTFAGKGTKYTGYPKFNSPESLAYNLKKLGFDVLSTANNHCYDSGYDGIESTIKYLDDADISHTGTFTSPEKQNDVLIKNVKGFKIAFISFTYGTNGITVPSDKSYSVNLINDSLITKQLNLAKEKNPDLIVACMHWGVEYQTTPNVEQKNLATFLFENGADIIIGNHPHVLQPMEKREITLSNGTKKDGFIVYSLGNFLADQNKNYTRDSAILNLNITKDEDSKITINSCTYVPIYNYKDAYSKSQGFKIIDLKNVVSAYDAGYTDGITDKMYNTFKTELNNVKKLLGNEIR